MESPRSTSLAPVSAGHPDHGARIRAARAAADLSREELGRRIGSSARAIRRLEDGGRRCTADELRGIAAATGAPEWFLVNGWCGWEQAAAGDRPPRPAADADDR